MKRWISCLLLLVGSAYWLPLPATSVKAREEPLVVVVGLAFPRSDISLGTLKSIFRGQRITIAGVQMVPFNHPPKSPLRVAMDRFILGLEPEAVGNFWIDMKIRDQGSPPRTVPSNLLGLRVAAAHNGAIFYTTPSALVPQVKALTIDGKPSTDGGYALRR